jgi:SAM-dependent methyltransferase
VAGAYARFRPGYPRALFEVLAGLSPARSAAWDCATGSGQAALSLAQDFTRVIATDISGRQLAEAYRHPRVRYVRSRSEAAPIRSRSIALVTVAQALHWFDLGDFWKEVARVLVPAGVVAVWCYNLSRISPPVDAIVERYYRETVGPFWPPERALLENGYREVPFPFEELAIAPPQMITRLTLDDFLGYVGTWSATERCREAHGEDPLPALAAALGRWWPRDEPLNVHWPLSLRVGRVQ